MLIVSATWAQFTFLMKIEAERLKKKNKALNELPLQKPSATCFFFHLVKDQVTQFLLVYHM